MKNTFYLILGLIIVLGSVFLFLTRTTVRDSQVKIIQINDTNIEVEIADTTRAREKGLSGRESLPEGTGMFFIFAEPARYEFWMKDMRLSIDIVWIDENFKIVDIEKEISPETFPQIFYPNQAIKYVLELPAGASDRHNIEIGNVIQYK